MFLEFKKVKYSFYSFFRDCFGTKDKKIKKKSRKLSSLAIIFFLSSLLLCSFLISITIINRINVEKLQMEYLILEKSFRINEVILRLLYKTETLASIIIKENGDVDNYIFDKIASSIVDDNSVILNVLIAPNGIVSNIYPLIGNEAVIGLNFFNEKIGNKETIYAKESGNLVLIGPFKTSQNGYSLVGRLPVFLGNQTEKNNFWGVVSIMLKFPQVLLEADLEIFKTQGFVYELCRVNPDTNEKEILVTNYENLKPNFNFIEKHISIMNASWYLKVWNIHKWYDYPENLALIIAVLLISFLVLFVSQNNYELREMKFILEDMAQTDPLTGIYNRRHFAEISQISLERTKRLKTDCYVVIFDLDKFKNINDTYGHIIGDKVLIEVTLRIKKVIRPYDFFARYGGEEFIILVSDIDKNNINGMIERLRLCICNKKFEYDNVSLDLSASFGVALANDYDLAKATERADKALYIAKEQGRNKIVFYDENNV